MKFVNCTLWLFASVFLLVPFAWFFVPCVAQAAMVVNSSGVSNNLKNGLVGWWTFDGGDSNGSTIYDRSNSASITNGTLVGSRVSPGKLGQGVALTGIISGGTAQSYVSVTDILHKLDPTPMITVSAWVYPTSRTVGSILVRGPAATAAGIENKSYKLYYLANGTIGWRLWSNGVSSIEIDTTETIPLNKWTLVTATCKDGEQNIYFNGVLTKSGSSALASIYFYAQTDPFYIGRNTAYGGDDAFQGNIDDVRIYNRILLANEVYSLYKYGSAKITVNSAGVAKDKLTNGLVGWWTMDGGQTDATNSYDSSGNAKNAVTSSLSKVAGKIGQAFNFTSNSTTYSLDSHASYYTNSNGVGTLSMWFKGKRGSSQGSGVGALFELGDQFSESFTAVFMGSGASGDYADESIGFVGYTPYNTSCTRIWVRKGGSYYYDDKWHHLVVVGDSGGSADKNRIYIDGIKQTVSLGTSDVNTSACFFKHTSGSAPTKLRLGGRLYNGSPNIYFDGSIDDTRIYNRAFSDSEVYSLYQYGNAKINVASQAVANQGTKSGLVGHWTFNGADCGATWCVDKSGLGNTGTITYFTKQNGKIGQGLYNNNVTGAHIRINDDSDISGLGRVSFGGWVKGSDRSDYNYILTKWQSPATNNEYHLRAEIASGFPYCTTATSGSHDVTRDTTGVTNIVDGKWHHVMCVYDGTAETTRIYVDGKQDNTTLTGKGGTLTDGNLPLSIGDLSDASNPARAWNGTLDDIRVYSRVLSANEIYSLYMYGK